ncbi:MAG TPA: hypothetical protein VF661_11100, partial [Actinomycetales bacterium]
MSAVTGGAGSPVAAPAIAERGVRAGALRDRSAREPGSGSAFGQVLKQARDTRDVMPHAEEPSRATRPAPRDAVPVAT